MNRRPPRRMLFAQRVDVAYREGSLESRVLRFMLDEHPSAPSRESNKHTTTGSALAGMVHIPGGSFRMGSDQFYPEERPVHRVAVDAFWIDARPVTNLEFGRFVEETGHVTVAEQVPDRAAYPGVDPGVLVPGSLVFRKLARRVPLQDVRLWWAWVPGAWWREPEGPGSTLDGREGHPVVHVAFADAMAYAQWAGKSLPTEAEWEYAARGGLDGAVYAWGDDFAPDGRHMANTWQGEFPWQNLASDGYEGTSPAGTFPPNGFGLYDMAGNVWEWTSDHFEPQPAVAAVTSCCVPRNLRTAVPAPADPATMGSFIPRRVVKGGSHLCAPNYCLRYRPAARQGEAEDTSTCHIGFRCVVRPSAEPTHRAPA